MELFGEPLALQEKIIAHPNRTITGYDGTYYLEIDLQNGEVRGKRLGLLFPDGLFVDGENYKSERALGEDVYPLEVSLEEAKKTLSLGEPVETYEYDETSLEPTEQKAFEFLYDRMTKKNKIVQGIGVVFYENGKVEWVKVKSWPSRIEEYLDQITEPIEPLTVGIPQFGFYELATLWRFR